MLVNIGIINGYYDNTFRPNEYMTRAELVTVIDNLLGIESETDKYVSDIASRDWYYSNMRKAVYFGIIQGDEKGKVNPNSKVTREEAVVIIARAFKIELDEAYFNSTYKDANRISEWARKEYMSFIRKQYIKGYEDNTVKPKKNITRAEILIILNRIINNISPSLYSAKINGNTLIKDRNVIMNNVEIFGDLIVGEQAAKTVIFTNTIVNGKLILYAPIDMQSNTIAVNGEIVKAYENKSLSNSYYINKEYGLTFPIPDGATTYDGMSGDNRDYSKKDLIIVNSEKKDEFYYQSMENVTKNVLKNIGYDSIFLKESSGDIQKYPFELYADNVSSHLLIIKRDNVVYSILFLNVVSNNVIDNVITNLSFTSGTNITNHNTVIYRNSKLALKFNYKNGYVGVDDSYNTNNVYSGDSIFKLFIQVNMITDINDYSIEQVKALLKTFVKNDGEIVNEEVMKINNHNAIQFEINSENDKIISLYVIIGNNLYNFIFKGEARKVELLGKDMFNTIVNSMEF
ncbi:MAG: S-layer homology domain-containing protein [Clostridia bacterium]|nr:S-layer homology domain-containing protein [Clostridia bacterium]